MQLPFGRNRFTRESRVKNGRDDDNDERALWLYLRRWHVRLFFCKQRHAKNHSAHRWNWDLTPPLAPRSPRDLRKAGAAQCAHRRVAPRPLAVGELDLKQRGKKQISQFSIIWVHSSVVRAADCRSAGPWFKSGCALPSHCKSAQDDKFRALIWLPSWLSNRNLGSRRTQC